MTQIARRRDLFDDLFDFRQSFDELFNRLTGTSRTFNQRPSTVPTTIVPPVEAWVDKDAKKYNLRVALPGIDPNQVQLSVEGNLLTISGEQKSSTEKKEPDYQLCEFAYGRFERTIILPEGADTDKLNAEYKDGVLEITCPVSAAALPRRIDIKSLPRAKGAGA